MKITARQSIKQDKSGIGCVLHSLTRMQNLILLVGLLLLTIFSTTCTRQDAVFTIKAALAHNPDEPQVRALNLFKQAVEEETAGRIRVEIYSNNQLGNQRDVIEGIQLGTIEISCVSAVMAAFIK